MDNIDENDAQINGSGSISGGRYKDVKIHGSGKIMSDIECRNMVIAGSGRMVGNLSAESLSIKGSGCFTGGIKAQDISIKGKSSFENAVRADHVLIAGSADIKGNLDANQIDVRGTVKIDGDCNTEKFHSDGAFSISGLLNGDDIDIRLWNSSRAQEIGGDKIAVQPGENGSFKSIFGFGPKNAILEADTIEGDEIFLENTAAKVVRGNHVKIGPGCRIGLVEYKTACEKDDSAKVENERKI